MSKKISELARWMIDNPSAIREIMSLVAEFEKHPEKWPRKLVYLAGGWPQDTPPRILRQKMEELLKNEDLWKKGARYSPTVGFPDTREAVVNYEKVVWGRKIDINNVIFGLGSSEQIGAVFLTLLNPGDEVILTSPGYLNYKRQLDLEMKLNARVRYWKIIDDNGAFSPDIDDLQGLITNKTKLIIITTPGNPDGQVWDDNIIRALQDIASEREVYILFDVAYRAFIFEKADIPRYLSSEPEEWCIWSCTLSKELRVPGWRSSYLIIPEHLLRALDTIEQARTLAPTSLIQLVLTEVFMDNVSLNEIKTFYENGSKKYAEIANKTVSLLKEIPDLRILEPKGGFYVFFDVSNYDRDSKKVWLELINGYQVALAPGVDFNNFEGWLRLSFAPVIETPEVLVDGLNRMKEYFASKKH